MSMRIVLSTFMKLQCLERAFFGVHRRFRQYGVLLCSALLIWGQARAEGGPQLNLERTVLTAGMNRLDVQLAQTPPQHQIGLMWRKDMPQHEGMLFVFAHASTQCFWMRNTFLPLTAAFLADDGTIVNLADMKPLSTDSHCSAQPVRYVLEMNQGWFAKKGLIAGSRLSGPPFEGKR